MDLALANDIEIVLNNEMVIYLQLTNSSYCTYTGLGGSEFVETPQELINWVNKVIEK